jgi:hypothetical protein
VRHCDVSGYARTLRDADQNGLPHLGRIEDRHYVLGEITKLPG